MSDECATAAPSAVDVEDVERPREESDSIPAIPAPDQLEARLADFSPEDREQMRGIYNKLMALRAEADAITDGLREQARVRQLFENLSAELTKAGTLREVTLYH